jgi:DNA-binding response OmpR family regulator
MASILLVEDDAALRHLFERMLVRDGHEVTMAANGAKALKLIETTPFDIVITDLIMPEMEGLSLLRELRKSASPPRVIAMSGGGRGSSMDYLEMATMLGAAATLAKPFTQKELTDVVELVIRKES